MAQELKDTLQLPKTDFPMRANLVQREPARLAHWETLGLYERIQKRNSDTGKVFVLHDGPPFTNGDVHIGTALNKTLKDITLRYKSMRGFRTPYVPGWDCHGLPIEQKVTRDLQDKKQTVTTAELRAKCDEFSESWIAKQTAQFKRLGVLADWKNEYKTKAPPFEADIVRTFAAFVEKDLVYRAKKPVYWSIPFETALAEAEIEYKDHTSIAIWVKFPVPADEAKKFGLPTDKPLSIVIWTTTPWTIPANLAIAVNPDEEYSTVRIGPAGDHYYLLFSKKLASKVLSEAKLAGPVSNPGNLPPNAIWDSRPSPLISKETQDGFHFSWVDIRLGKNLEKLVTRHPFIDRASPVVLANYVTMDSGTGCVHTAPGHGMDDYQTGLKYGLEIYCPVDADGKYLDDGRVPADLVGLTTLETVEDLEKKRTSPANIGVLKKLAATNTLLAKEKFTHSYPHCWRSKTPIIFRAVDQWFVGLDREEPPIETPSAIFTPKRGAETVVPGGKIDTRNTPRNLANDAIGNVQWIPAWGEARIRGAVESRPDWCVSRQRAWGVPIPAFYDTDKKAYLDAGVARAIADKIEKLGTNFWYDATPEKILEGVKLPAGWPVPSALTCGRDTLDVWLDSGSSHAAVLARGQGGTQWPADLYLEGSDQHRGWFQSSLWTSVISRGAAPYKAVLTHGFIVDEDRKKISKSSTYEKPQTSDAYIGKLGADVVRLWIASQDFRDDIPISDEILGHVGETYRLFRNTFRYQISVLNDFDLARDAVPVEQMDTLDRWALHQTVDLSHDCEAAYESYAFHQVYQLCNQFCSVTLSATYHDILKDRLYTLAANSPLRRSSQTAIHHIFQTLVKILAPIVLFTTDEAWSFATDKTEYATDSVHLQDWPVAPVAWTSNEVDADVVALLRVRAQVNEALEPARQAGHIGKSLDAAIVLTGAAEDTAFKILEKHRDFLPELFIVSHVTLTPTAGVPLNISVRPAQELGYVRCPRCWRWVPALENTVHGDVCPRCVQALSLI